MSTVPKKIRVWLSVLAVMLIGVTASACSSQEAVETQPQVAITIPTPTPITEEFAQISGVPSVTISSPEQGEQFGVGEIVTVISKALDDQGIEQVALLVDGQVVVINENPTPKPSIPFTVSQVWQFVEPGIYTLQVRAYAPNSAAGESQPVQIQVGASSPSVDEQTQPDSGSSQVPTPTPDYAYLEVVAPNGMRVYETPNLNDPNYAMLESGETAPILGRYNGGATDWWQIVFPDGFNGIGWVPANPEYAVAYNAGNVGRALPLSAEGPPVTATPTVPLTTSTPGFPYLVVTSIDAVNVYSGPGAHYPVVGQLLREQPAQISGWSEIGAQRWWRLISPPGWIVDSPDQITVFNAGSAPVIQPPPPPAPPTTPPTATSTPEPAPPQAAVEFTVDRTSINAGECVNFYWNAANIREIYFNEQGVAGENQFRTECPDRTQTYSLRVVDNSGQSDTKSIRIDVSGSSGSSKEDDTIRQDHYIDFDDGDVSDNRDDEDDYQYRGDEFRRAHDDSDLDVAIATDDADDDAFGVLSRGDCEYLLDNNEDDSVTAREDRLICFRTNENRIGKLRFEDVEDDRIRIEWALW